jgi:hypothetical protein
VVLQLDWAERFAAPRSRSSVINICFIFIIIFFIIELIPGGLTSSQLTLPSLTVIEGLNLNPKPLCPLQGRGLTAPPVALTLRYPKTIKGLGCILTAGALKPRQGIPY